MNKESSPEITAGEGSKKNLEKPHQVYAQLVATLQAYMRDPYAFALVEKAYQFAVAHHGLQLRKSGEAYIVHPLTVAIILAELRVDIASIISAILHDVVEDTEATLSEVERDFGKAIAELVDGLTKIGKIKFRSSQERMAENFRKMIIAMAKDIRVILVKLADRLHNMRTLSFLPPEKRRRIAQETLEIYAPLASRLGIYSIKSELEDLCLKETKPEVYKEISRKIASKKTQREMFIQEVISVLEDEFAKYGFKSLIISGRPKHFYSIYRKMVDRRIAFEDIHDLLAFRIIVDSIKDCYEALGIVHAMWKPMPGRFKDYIAMPKANLYQSLHTTVIRPNGSTAEIQIRTNEMHHVCEYGIAAHWTYKEDGVDNDKSTNLKRFAWLRQMMELHQDVKDPEEFLNAVKVDLFEEEIFVFTPRGDVIQLAVGATPLDFAFAVHTDIGLTTVGAKVNGKITPLRRSVQSGDIVEILTSPHQKPSKDWLNFVTTSKARNKIRSFLRSEQRERSHKMGRSLLGNALSKRDFDLDKLSERSQLDPLVKAAKESNFDDVLVAVGYGRLNPAELIERAFPTAGKKLAADGKISSAAAHEELEENKILPPTSQAQSKKYASSGILVSGMDNILVTFGRCCNPLPGDGIVGFVTRGRGVSIHRSNCPRALDLDPVRRVEVSWGDGDQNSKPQHSAYLKIITHDRQGILADISMAIAACGANIQKAQVKVSSDLMGVLDFEVNIKSLAHLNKVIGKLESIPNVVLVERREIDPSRIAYNSRMIVRS